MSEITVEVGPPYSDGGLVPRYDTESDILAVGSPSSRPWPFGVDVDGHVILDIDADRVLANFDLHIGAQLWEQDSDIAWPTSGRDGPLVFTEDALRIKSFSLPLRVSVHPDAGIV